MVKPEPIRNGDRVQTFEQTDFGTVVMVSGGRLLVDFGSRRQWLSMTKVVYAPDAETIQERCDRFRGKVKQY